jgi:UMF1 family MFS transporter
MNKQQKAWAFYDWANSVYALVISTAVFPLYYEWVAPEVLDTVFGPMESAAVYSFTLSASFVVVALGMPFLASISDRYHGKKFFLQFFLGMGSIACAAMFFFTSKSISLGLMLSFLASIGFCGSIVFYNSYLPVIAPKEVQDRLSARGFSLGYLGSSLLLILCLALIMSQESDEGKKMAFRYSFVLVGIWWAGFSLITLKRLPSEDVIRERFKWNGLRKEALGRLRETMKNLKKIAFSRRFLMAYFFLSVGVQTIILIASLYGSNELKLDSTKLIGTILVIQFVGILGAWLFGRLSEQMGNITALLLATGVWTVICLIAYSLNPEDPSVEVKFYFTAGLVGLVMGGTQSLCRSTFSKILPHEEEHAAYFSFMEITEKLAIVLGTGIFGVITQVTSGMRVAALTLSLFFLTSLILLASLRKVMRKHISAT